MLKVKVPTIFSAHSGFRHAGMDFITNKKICIGETKKFSLYISFTYKLSLFDFARLFVITFGNVYKQVLLYIFPGSYQRQPKKHKKFIMGRMVYVSLQRESLNNSQE